MARLRHVIKELDLHEISAVDNPAQVHARATIMKRASFEDEVEKRDFSQGERDAAANSGAAMPDGSFPIKSASDLHNAVALWGKAKNPEAAKRHIISRARELGAVGSLPDSWNVSKQGKVCPECDGEGCAECDQTGMMNVSGKEKPMSDETAKKIADLEAMVAKKDAEIADVKKAKEAAEQDEVIKVGETEVHKSKVGADSFAVIKAQNGIIANEIEKREMVELEKRAETEFAHLPGKAVEKAKVLKALNTMNEEARKALDVMLKAGEAALAKGFKETGHSFEGSSDKPVVKLEKYVQAYASDKKVEISKAYVDLSTDSEFRKLYSEAYGSKAA